jgi:polyphosphate:AMP phosphotransferase
MFEAAELGQKLAKSDYKERLDAFRAEILQAQFALAGSGRPVIILVEGVDNSNKGALINKLNEWLDTRGLEVNAFGRKTDEESERPRFWRYWRCMPPKGRIGIFSSSWYTGTIYQRTFGKIGKSRFDRHMRRINSLETMLARDGALILKFWLHMSKEHQKAQFKLLAKAKNSRWLVSPLDKELHEHYDQHIKSAERAIRLTDQVNAPWLVVEAEDELYRDMTVGETVLSALQHISNSLPVANTAIAMEVKDASTGKKSILNELDLGKSISKADYEAQLSALQTRLTQLGWQAYHARITTVLVFEGWDAAGKGGAIRRIMEAVDARISRVISIAAPTDEERAQHYLWRFWRHIPKAGRVIIYDRSWYGRVLVERVEGFAREDEWRRAYLEINDFEEQLCDHGINLQKFWLHIDKDEQLTRFKAREKIEYKRHKITDEDWRNRERWDDYVDAVNEMVVRTSTDYAHWTLVPANDKRSARIQVLEKVCDSLELALRKHKKSKHEV